MEWNWITILGALSYLIGILALFIIPANRKPGEATAWLLLIFVAPILGAIPFLLLGNPKLSKWRREQQRAMNERFKDLAEEAEQIPDLTPLVDPPVSSRYEPLVNLIAQLTGMPSMAGNTVEYLPDYVGVVDRIVQDIDAAGRFVHLEYFMFADDKVGAPVIDALVRARGHDGGSLRVFRQFSWLEVGSVKAALSRPTHPRATRAVGQTWRGLEQNTC